MWAVLGVGNPGSRYRGTRHNVGFEVLEATAERLGTTLRPAPGPYRVAEATWEGQDLLLVEPQTYVNRSGVAVRLLAERARIEPQRLLAVVDDVHLPFGRLRLRGRGSAGGHNGLRSIETALGSREYPRLRIGVGAAQPGQDLADHVLAPFEPEERLQLPAVIERAVEAVLDVVTEGVEAVAPRVNAPPASGPAPD